MYILTHLVYLYYHILELEIRIKMNDRLYLRNPEDSVLGRKIVRQGIILINKIGFEEFTFKKLAILLQSTEASIYRYFENKHKFLIYLINWYWAYLEYKLLFHTNNISSPERKLKTIIRLLVDEPTKNETEKEFISEKDAYLLVMWEGSKTYLTRNVTKDNKDRLFKPYKDLCARISNIIRDYNPKYKFPISLASSLLELSHSQKFFMQNLPSLTDSKQANDKQLIAFLESFVFSAISK